MKYLILLILFVGCQKKSTAPSSTAQIPVVNTPTVPTSKYVEIYITYGAVNNFCSVKWSYDPNIDSAYTTSNSVNRTIRNYTNSDSIFVYTTSQVANQQQPNTVMVVVNGVIKEQYTGTQVAKKIKL